MSKTKKKLLNHLNNDIYCRIGVSKIHGVGVIAIKDIPPNTNPFMMTDNVCLNYNGVKLKKSEIDQIEDRGVRKIIFDFISPDSDGNYYVPYYGPNSMNISFYLNHSKNSNLDVISDSCEYMGFKTNRLIKKGEELFINYDHYGDNFSKIVDQ